MKLESNLSAAIEDLTKRLGDLARKFGDLERKYEDNSEEIMSWQVASQAVEGLKSRCLSHANIVC